MAQVFKKDWFSGRYRGSVLMIDESKPTSGKLTVRFAFAPGDIVAVGPYATKQTHCRCVIRPVRREETSRALTCADFTRSGIWRGACCFMCHAPERPLPGHWTRGIYPGGSGEIVYFGGTHPPVEYYDKGGLVIARVCCEMSKALDELYGTDGQTGETTPEFMRLIRRVRRASRRKAPDWPAIKDRLRQDGIQPK